MPASAAQMEANRKNAQRSTGPRTPEGKERSRANALKHGMTGEGVVLLDEDAAEVALRNDELESELRPSGRMGRIMVHRIAMISVRLERSERNEFATIARRIGRAEADYDAERADEVEKAFDWITADPAANARRLRETPEGIDRTIRGLLELKEALFHPYGERWDWIHCEKVHNLMGMRRVMAPITRLQALGEAVQGNYRFIGPEDGGDLDDPGRRAWAKARVGEVIDGEVEALRALRDTLDVEALALDRAGARDRALFDPSKEAILARKYEAAAERGLFRALREFRQIEAEAAEAPAPRPGPDPTPEAVEDCEPLGSFFPGPGATPSPAVRPSGADHDRAVGATIDGPMSSRMARTGPA